MVQQYSFQIYVQIFRYFNEITFSVGNQERRILRNNDFLQRLFKMSKNSSTLFPLIFIKFSSQNRDFTHDGGLPSKDSGDSLYDYSMRIFSDSKHHIFLICLRTNED